MTSRWILSSSILPNIHVTLDVTIEIAGKKNSSIMNIVWIFTTTITRYDKKKHVGSTQITAITHRARTGAISSQLPHEYVFEFHRLSFHGRTLTYRSLNPIIFLEKKNLSNQYFWLKCLDWFIFHKLDNLYKNV